MFEIFTMLIRNMLLTGAYQNQVFKDPLSAEEETYYIEKLKNNDNHAREVLIEHNLRLVAHIVKKYSENKDEVDDLISIGTIGLIKGVDSQKVADLAGKGLMIPFMNTNSGSRKILASTQKEHVFSLMRPEKAILETGYEIRFGDYSSSVTKADSTYRVVGKISKFSFIN